MEVPSGRLLTTREVAERLAVSLKTLEGWRYRGTGPPSVALSPRSVRYPEAALEAWLAERWEHEATRREAG